MDAGEARRQAEEARRRAAVRHPAGRQLILAGPGGGKTQILVDRTVWLIREHGIAPAQIRLVAFTRRAVGEFTRRLRARLGEQLPHVSTLHAAAVRVLRDHGGEWLTAQGLTADFRFLEDGEDLEFFTRVLERHPELLEGLPTTHDGADYFQALQYERLHREDGEPDPGSPLLPAYQRYHSLLRSVNAVDPAELVPLAAALLEADSEVRERVQVRHLLVDEAQDLNPAQLRLLRLLADGEQYLDVVGDPDQAIFSWQGADPWLLERLLREEVGWNVVKLEANYRSTAAILRASAAVLPPRDPARPRQFPTRGEGEPVRVIPCSHREDESRRVADWLEEQQQQGFSWPRMAVLARNHARLVAVEEVLLLRGIAYQAARTSFFERPGVAEPLAYLRFLGGDQPALAELLRYPPRGVRPEDLTLLEQLARERSGTLRQLLVDTEALPLPRIAQMSLGTSHRLLLRLERSLRGAERVGPDLDRLLNRVLRETGLTEWLAQQPLSYAREQNAVRNLELLRQLVKTRCPGRGEQPLASLLQLARSVRAPDPLALEVEPEYSPHLAGTGDHEPPDEMGIAPLGVQLLTLHQSKGLEFDAVAIVGCERFTAGRRQCRPEKRRGTGVRQSEPGAVIVRVHEAPDHGDRSDEVDLPPGRVQARDAHEEQRLLYVGMTRARDRLALFAVSGNPQSVLPDIAAGSTCAAPARPFCA